MRGTIGTDQSGRAGPIISNFIIPTPDLSLSNRCCRRVYVARVLILPPPLRRRRVVVVLLSVIPLLSFANRSVTGTQTHELNRRSVERGRLIEIIFGPSAPGRTIDLSFISGEPVENYFELVGLSNLTIIGND